MRNTKSSVKSIPDVSEIDGWKSTRRSLECCCKDHAERLHFRWKNILSGFLKTLGFLVENERSVGLWRKNLKWKHKTCEDHQNPDCPSPADGFSDVPTDNRSEYRSDKGTDQEDGDANDLFKSRTPHLLISQVRKGNTSMIVPAPRVAGGEAATPDRSRRTKNPAIF